MDPPEEPWATSAPNSRPASIKSARSSRSSRKSPGQTTEATEATPLLAGVEQNGHGQDEAGPQTPAAASLRRSLSGSREDKTPFWKKRWPSILALVLLCILVVLIMLGFLASEGIEEYAMQAADFQPTKMSLDRFTDTGVRVQVEGDFHMDASKVQKKSVRNLGRFGTWIAREVESGPTDVDVYLPEYGNVLLGTARLPGVKVNVRNGHTTHVVIESDVEPGPFDGIRNVADDWIKGRLGEVRVLGKARVPLKSGLIRIGTQTVEQTIVFKGNDLPSIPGYDITKINIRAASHGNKGMAADVSVLVKNDFPVHITMPPVSVDVLVDGCGEQRIMIGTGETAKLNVQPRTDVQINATGHVESLPESLTEICPKTTKSPLDALLGNYMHGQDATIYINCCNFPDPESPDWARNLLDNITLPMPVAGRDMGNLIKNFSLVDVHFSLPDPFAEPDTPEAQPKISAVVKVDIGLPDEMNFPLDVDRVRADADVFYHNKKMGKLDLRKWQHANSTRVPAHGKAGPSMLVESRIKEAPLEILDGDVFSEVVQALIFGGKPVVLDIKAAVSVSVDTPMGNFTVRDIPAEGKVPVKPIGHHKGEGDETPSKSPFSAIGLKMGNLSIIDTTPTSITFEAHVNFTNPTNYSATIPYFNINILENGTVIGQAIVENLYVRPGNNSNLAAKAVWAPFTHSGDKGRAIGRELLSQYVSGYNTSLTVQTHKGSVPLQPSIGLALSHFPLTFPFPHLSNPSDPPPDSEPSDPSDPDEDKGPHFIRDATMHIISSTALFTLASPFSTTTMFLTHMNATAYHDGHPSGKILYNTPFAVPPGLSTTPRLPVEWSLGSVGFEAVKQALGGTLRLTAFAEVGVRIGQWREEIWVQTRGIGAHVRL